MTGFLGSCNGELAPRKAKCAAFANQWDTTRLLNRPLNRHIEAKKFVKPHRIKVQGQTFLQSEEYRTAVTVRIAAHEMPHPPIPMQGSVAKKVLSRLAEDKLEMRIDAEHDPKWGYTTLEGLFNEALVQALDLLIG